MDANKTQEENSRWELNKNAACFFKINLRSNTPQKGSCTATYLPSHKPSKYNEQDMRSTTGEVRMNSKATFSYGLIHIDTLVLSDQ